jgi:ribosome production factor 2
MSKIPRVELEEMGPALDLRIVQSRWASDDLRREATKIPKELKPKKMKNITTNVMKEKVGRVFVPTQDISKLVPATIKGLRRKRKRQDWEEVEERDIQENSSSHQRQSHTNNNTITTESDNNNNNNNNNTSLSSSTPSLKKTKTDI